MIERAQCPRHGPGHRVADHLPHGIVLQKTAPDWSCSYHWRPSFKVRRVIHRDLFRHCLAQRHHTRAASKLRTGSPCSPKSLGQARPTTLWQNAECVILGQQTVKRAHDGNTASSRGQLWSVRKLGPRTGTSVMIASVTSASSRRAFSGREMSQFGSALLMQDHADHGAQANREPETE